MRVDDRGNSIGEKKKRDFDKFTTFIMLASVNDDRKMNGVEKGVVTLEINEFIFYCWFKK